MRRALRPLLSRRRRPFLTRGKAACRAFGLATPKEGESSNFLAEQLGGYTLELDADGRFSSDWRGLTKKGTWKLDKDALVLSPTEVLGKSLAESGTDRALFEEDNRLAISPGDSTLTLSAKDKDSQTVIFTKAKG